jgi:ectoine hydroxylase-related dioxygenase (phytanoyl-CoA dioxygenase family)
VVDIPLVDFRPDNGAMEIWPGGTHLMPPPTDIEAVVREMHSEQVIMPAGSLLIRDARMWHRGSPNKSGAPRPNMALMYARHWFKTMYPQIGIRQEIYDMLPERSQQLFRHEDIGRGEDPRQTMVTRWT